MYNIKTDMEFKLYDKYGLVRLFVDYDELIKWLIQNTDGPGSSISFRYYRDNESENEIYKSNIFLHNDRKCKSKYVFANNWDELYEIPVDYICPNYLVVDNFGRIVNMNEIYSDLIKLINNDYNINRNDIFDKIKIDMNNIEINRSNKLRMKRIGIRTIVKNVMKNEKQFIFYLNRRKEKIKLRYRMDPIPKNRYRTRSRRYIHGIVKQIIEFEGSKYLNYYRGKRRSILKTCGMKQITYKSSWKYYGKNIRQWEKNSQRKNKESLKNWLHEYDKKYAIKYLKIDQGNETDIIIKRLIEYGNLSTIDN